jgi:hypothetical protein
VHNAPDREWTLYRAIFESAPDAILVLNSHGTDSCLLDDFIDSLVILYEWLDPRRICRGQGELVAAQNC